MTDFEPRPNSVERDRSDSFYALDIVDRLKRSIEFPVRNNSVMLMRSLAR